MFKDFGVGDFKTFCSSRLPCHAFNVSGLALKLNCSCLLLNHPSSLNYGVVSALNDLCNAHYFCV
jgi:hypothetical protein